MFSPVYGGVRGGFIRNDRIGTFARASSVKKFEDDSKGG
jgi:hypothetical protein